MGDYQDKAAKLILAAIERGEIAPGSVVDVDVFHDDWCPFNDAGECKCDPTITIRATPKPGLVPPEYDTYPDVTNE